MYPCLDECGKVWQSLAAAMQCPCDHEDAHGYPKQEHGTDWLP